jgi:hypothetical protein
MTAEEYADNKYTPKAKEYAETSSIKAVYDNCIVDFNAGYKECQEEVKPIMIKLFSLWESLAEAGEIHIGPEFSENYNKLKQAIK